MKDIMWFGIIAVLAILILYAIVFFAVIHSFIDYFICRFFEEYDERILEVKLVEHNK